MIDTEAYAKTKLESLRSMSIEELKEHLQTLRASRAMTRARRKTGGGKKKGPDPLQLIASQCSAEELEQLRKAGLSV